MTSIDKLCSHTKSKLDGNYQNSVRFMIECTKIYYKFIPAVGIESLEVAKKYWLEKIVSITELQDAKSSCWSFLDANKSSTKFDTSDVCALRAVMVLLYPESDDVHADDSLDFYFEMLDLMNVNKQDLEILVNAIM